MKELLEDIVKSLVTKPEAVSISEKESGGTVIYQLTVASEDMGKVIGRQGKIARAIRSVMKAAAVINEKKVMVDII